VRHRERERQREGEGKRQREGRSERFSSDLLAAVYSLIAGKRCRIKSASFGVIASLYLTMKKKERASTKKGGENNMGKGK
jgi:hypothetical protein